MARPRLAVSRGSAARLRMSRLEAASAGSSISSPCLTDPMRHRDPQLRVMRPGSRNSFHGAGLGATCGGAPAKPRNVAVALPPDSYFYGSSFIYGTFRPFRRSARRAATRPLQHPVAARVLCFRASRGPLSFREERRVSTLRAKTGTTISKLDVVVNAALNGQRKIRYTKPPKMSHFSV